MGTLTRRWIRRVSVILGIAGMLTPALIDLGWIPQTQAMSAVLFLLGLLVVNGATAETDENSVVPKLFEHSEDSYDALIPMIGDTRHEYFSVVHGHEVLLDAAASFVRK